MTVSQCEPSGDIQTVPIYESFSVHEKQLLRAYIGRLYNILKNYAFPERVTQFCVKI